jgi:hypothetical protein
MGGACSVPDAFHRAGSWDPGEWNAAQFVPSPELGGGTQLNRPDTNKDTGASTGLRRELNPFPTSQRGGQDNGRARLGGPNQVVPRRVRPRCDCLEPPTRSGSPKDRRQPLGAPRRIP